MHSSPVPRLRPLLSATPTAAVAVLLLLAPATARAQDATLDAPSQAVVGASIELTWTGPSDAREFISIDPVGAPESTYGPYIYAQVDQPGTLQAPDEPGSYVIRYHSGESGYPVLATSPLELVDTEATFEELSTVQAGEDVTVTWEGPGNARDFISIDPVGAGDREYGAYAYASRSPVTIRAPDEAGEYVVRYHLAGSYRVIGSARLTVAGADASLTAPSEAPAGSEVQVTWEGPDGRGDWISADEEGAGDREYGSYAYTSSGNPLSIRLPEEPGRYELRYHMGQSYTVLASSPIEVLPTDASVEGPATAAGGSEIEVTWTGPDNRGDFVTIVPEGADNREYLSYGYTSEGSTLLIEAPLDPGPHELRYVTGQTRRILASAPIEVTPGLVPGELRVVAAGEAGVPGPGTGAVEVILDASGSMLQRLEGERRIDIAKGALTSLVRDIVPAGTPFALRVFGHREVDSCRTDLEIPVSSLEPGEVTSTIEGIEAMNLARTPIAASLAAVPNDLAGVDGPVVVVLVTDGEETCDGDPGEAIRALRESGYQVRVDIVGFAIDEQRLREEFETWARLGNGRYVEANDGAELAEAVGAALRVPYEVLDGEEVVATGIVDGEPLRLAPGTYRVRLLGSTPEDLGEVTVEPGGTHAVEAGG